MIYLHRSPILGLTALLYPLLAQEVTARPGGSHTLSGDEKNVAEIIRNDMEHYPELYIGQDFQSYLKKFMDLNQIGKRKLNPGDILDFPETPASVKEKRIQQEQRKLKDSDFEDPDNTRDFLKKSPLLILPKTRTTPSSKTPPITLSGTCSEPLPAPVIYPSYTVIDGRPWESPAPTGFPSGTWILVSGPADLSINPETGAAYWTNPKKHRNESVYEIRMELHTGKETIPVQWYLRIVDNDVPDAEIFSTEYIDYIIPKKYADWMRENQFAEVIDPAWERFGAVMGCFPADGKQAVKYAPDMGGGAHCGNPVMIGPGWWTDLEVDGWTTFNMTLHEVGHNFHGCANIRPIISGDNPRLDKFFHHGMQLSQESVFKRIKPQLEAYGIRSSTIKNFLAYEEKLSDEALQRGQGYLKWYRNEKNPMDFDGDSYGVGMRICHEICEELGLEVLEKTLMLVRWDGLPPHIYKKAQSDEQRNAILVGMFSVSSGRDLSKYFQRWGFELDYEFLNAVIPGIKKVADELPPPDVDGWCYCSLNGCYYRLTPWRMSFYAAEAVANSMNCHLAPVRSKEENDWLAKRYAGRGPLWVGISDQEREECWKRLDDTNTDFFDWRAGEPNGQRFENHVAMYYGDLPSWIDANAESSFMAIIEYNPANH